MSRNVVVVTGTRAEYGILRSVMERIRSHPKLDLTLVVTGMHLSSQYGHTIDDIRADGFEIDRTVDTLLDGDSGVAMAKSLGIGVASMADTVRDLDGDVVLVLGDRGEALAAGIAAAHQNVPVAHIHGGDAMEGAVIDDSIRHALTKFAHLHFPGSERAARRIEQLGEERWRISPAGALALDEIIEKAYTPPETVRDRYDLRGNLLLLVVQHPETARPDATAEQMRKIMAAVTDFDATVAVVYPNSDAGSRGTISVIEEYEGRPNVQTFRNLPREDYLGLLAATDVMVGNSSSAIVEAPSLGVPAVDIGDRQKGRERAEHTISAPYDREAIRSAIETGLSPEAQHRAETCDNPYDFGGAAETIVSRLAGIDIKDRLREKRFVDRFDTGASGS
jgi:UDP-N-acetylglucosamine 2-epimerase (non-hydrolysing)/GDP/UDP-N,N'-diacetylbacillosamine 2-epimerase (hydrolysing)